MHLLGRRAWYIPRWLDRALPPLTIEPAEHAPEADAAPDEESRPHQPVLVG
jgi:RND superfamily putative drug exporter